jgi:hypothetical protein
MRALSVRRRPRHHWPDTLTTITTAQIDRTWVQRVDVAGPMAENTTAKISPWESTQSAGLFSHIWSQNSRYLRHTPVMMNPGVTHRKQEPPPARLHVETVR